MKGQQKVSLMKRQQMMLLSLVIFILIVSGGYFYYQYEKYATRREKYSELKTIADLKTDQIVHWREERLTDAHVFSESPFIRHAIQRWLLSKDNTLEKDLLERLSLINYKYEDVFIVSAEGKILLSLDTMLHHMDSVTINFCNKALRERRTFFSDFYFCPTHDIIHFDIFAPVLNNRNIPVAVLVLRVNPYDYLYPLIQSWPTSSKSAETLVIRKDGDSVLYVNELRHISNTALKLRIPLTSIETPSVQAVLGQVGICEGLDYRGMKVLADRRPIPGSPWFMIAKVDQREIFSELYYRSVIVIIVTLILLLLLGVGMAWLYNNRQKNIYRELLETGTALQESQGEFRATLYSIGDAVITTDVKGCIRNMNGVAEKLTGWKESDAVGRSIVDVFQIVNEESSAKVESPVQRVLKEGLVVGLANHTLLISKDGKEIPIADSGAPIRNEKGEITGVVLVFRDQTEERITQKALRENEAKFRTLVENIPQKILMKDQNYRWVTINENLARDFGFRPEEVVGKMDADLFTPELAAKYHSDDVRIMETGKTEELEEKYMVGGKETWVNTIKTPVWDKNGEIMGVLGVFWDITERKQAEEKILSQIEELKRWQEVTLGREDRNRQLKHEVNELLRRLGEPIRYPSQECDGIKNTSPSEGS
jgi:PAS domain S-box-containing protein